MSDVQIFRNAEFGAVRVVDVNGEPWFVASDIAKALGYERPNDAVNTHCKKVNDFRDSKMLPSATPMKIIPESDVYRLIMRSNLKNEDVDTTQAIRMHCEKAKDFRGVEMTATATPMKIIPEEDVKKAVEDNALC